MVIGAQLRAKHTTTVLNGKNRKLVPVGDENDGLEARFEDMGMELETLWEGP